MEKIEIPDESSAFRHEEIAAGETPTPNIEEIIAEDGILCLILSFLNLEEAVRTSVLSSRWRHIWTHLTKFYINPISVLDAPTLQSGHLDSIGTYETYNLEFYLTKLSSNLSHPQKLTLKLGAISRMVNLPIGSCRFIHLRHLDCQWDGSTKMGLLDVATLLDAAPFLEELKLCLSLHVLGSRLQASLKFWEMQPVHFHLKKIQISSFYFGMWDIEIAVYLLRKATELESMMIKKVSTSNEENIQWATKVLARETPLKVELVIL